MATGKAQFTYDFGIAIAQSTVNKVARLAGVTLTLAAGYYNLKKASAAYIGTLRENTLRMGGYAKTVSMMKMAQERQIQGKSPFNMREQLAGMNELMKSGIDVKKNMDWVEKAAHATGKSYSEFAGMISSAIAGNTGALVDAGLLTQRACRQFDKYEANTVMRQQAIMNFLKSNKSLQQAIQDDFDTIETQVDRLKGIWEAFLQAIIGDPNDPDSLYGQATAAVKSVADNIAKFWNHIKGVAYMIGHIASWIVKQVGNVIDWLGRKLFNTVDMTENATDSYVEKTRSIVVWLEFWKLQLLRVMENVGGKIKWVYDEIFTPLLPLLVSIGAAMGVIWAVGKVEAFCAVLGTVITAFRNLIKLQKTYMYLQLWTPGIRKGAAFAQSLAVFLPRAFRRAWVKAGKGLANLTNDFGMGTGLNIFQKMGRKISAFFNLAVMAPIKKLGLYIFSPFKSLFKFIKGFPALIARSFGKVRLFFAMMRAGMFSFWGVFGMLGKGLLRMFIGLGKFIISPFKYVFRMIPMLFNGIRAICTMLMAANPMVWIVAVVALIALLYNKCLPVRRIINMIAEYTINRVKIVWNLVVALVACLVFAGKKAWGWLCSFWNFIVGIYDGIIAKIRNMWNAFCNTKVGKWINDHIIQPLKSAFGSVVKFFSEIWDCIQSIIGGVAKFFGLSGDSDGVTNTASLAQKAAKEAGIGDVSGITANKQTNIDYDEDYLKKGLDKLTGSSNTGNPLTKPSPDSGVQPYASDHGAGGGTSTSILNFDKGSIVINVEKGEHIDENNLARKVAEVIENMHRSGRMVTGMV